MAEQKDFLKFNLADVIKISGILFIIWKFMFGTQQDIKDLRSTDISILKVLEQQTSINQQMTSYMQNHDAWTSMVTGKRFQAGVPIDPSWDAQGIRKLFRDAEKTATVN